ncbi:hypothetical protein evm_010889 [Chilo suppressalis]|nr:hypothetical protein evm_010889 [Chilo suppressalis]
MALATVPKYRMNNTQGVAAGSSRVYQGYPYTAAIVTDVPTIDAVTAGRYADLPRRQWQKDEPMVYIDIPSGSQSSVSQPNSIASPRPQQSTSKQDLGDNPVVYIDLPESSGSDVAERRRVENDESFVQETIFYDPFKDRRIVERSESDSSTTSGSADQEDVRPTPPNTLTLGSTNRGYASSSYSNLPASFAKETSIYGLSTPTNGYNRDDVPDPPPAYTETDTMSPTSTNTSGYTGTPTTSPGVAVAETSRQEPPRTQVITSTVASDKIVKHLFCVYCGIRGPTLVIKEAGYTTHMIAIILAIFGLFPLLILVYCFDFCKYDNHYCKNCNKKIAYELPICCKDLTYVT